MNLLQINTVVGTGSTGRIVAQVGQSAVGHGHQSGIAFGRGSSGSSSKLYRIGHGWDICIHGVVSLLTDRHGFGSASATKKFVDTIREIRPDIIVLHNLHGYYLHVGVLFDYLRQAGVPVVWVLHDCWAFTGHCAHFVTVACTKWQTHCHACPMTRRYPRSFGLDQSFRNFADKRDLFTGIPDLHLVTPSRWLADLIPYSFLAEYPVHHIPNGVDLAVFAPAPVVPSESEKIILGVANGWSSGKGFQDMVALSTHLPKGYRVVLIGLSKSQIRQLPDGVEGICRTNDLAELVAWYSRASVFVNPTYADTFPTTNLEALACGTPVVTYDTGGSPEAVDERTGKVVRKGDVPGLIQAVLELCSVNEADLRIRCRARAEQRFDIQAMAHEHLELYRSLIPDHG